MGNRDSQASFFDSEVEKELPADAEVESPLPANGFDFKNSLVAHEAGRRSAAADEYLNCCPLELVSKNDGTEERTQERPTDDPPVTGLNDSTNDFHIPKELLHALEARKSPYSRELADIRESIKTGKAIENLASKRNLFKNFYNSVEIDGPSGKKLQVGDTGYKGVYVVRHGDNTWILNEEHPALDSKFSAGAHAGNDFNWSQDEDLKETYNSMMIMNASGSLLEQSLSGEPTSREQAYESIQSMYEGAHKEGVVDDKQLARMLGYLGFRYVKNLDNMDKGLALGERALSLMENRIGKSAPDTIYQRAQLITHYLEAHKPASADSLLNKQMSAMLDAEKDRRGLDDAIVGERGWLVRQLNDRSKDGLAKEIQDRAFELVLTNPDAVELHSNGMINCRRQLIQYYKEQDKPEHVSKLYEQELKALNQLQTSDPTSYRVQSMRDGLISELGQMKDYKRLKPLLDDRRDELTRIERTYPEHSTKSLRNDRISLAQSYLQVGNAEQASETGKKVFDSANKDMMTADSATLQQRLELQSKLAGLEGKHEFNDFSTKTVELFREFEKKDKVDQAEVSQIRRLLAERAESRKDGKAMAGFLEDELKSLESQQPTDKSAIDACKQSLGDAMVMQGKNKEAATIYEKLAKDAASDSVKVEPLEKLAEVLDKLGRSNEAEAARNDAKAIRAGLPPEKFTSPTQSSALLPSI